MKKETVRPLNINLLRSNTQSVFDTVFSWAISVGRLLIIITQFVALGAFLFRFTLDRQIIDLNDKIRGKQSVVQFLSKDEKTYRDLQARLTTVAKYQDDATLDKELFSKIVKTARGKMEFNSLNASPQGISIEGISTSVGLLQNLINDFRAFPEVNGVNISSIDTQVQAGRIKASILLSLGVPASGSAALAPTSKTGGAKP